MLANGFEAVCVPNVKLEDCGGAKLKVELGVEGGKDWLAPKAGVPFILPKPDGCWLC